LRTTQTTRSGAEVAATAVKLAERFRAARATVILVNPMLSRVVKADDIHVTR
jgi:hypothetical protein